MTAKSIARDVGIITVDKTVDGTNPKELHSDPTETAVVIQGTTLREMSADEIDSILFRYREIVFARTSPTQKLQIVESLQRLGEIGKSRMGACKSKKYLLLNSCCNWRWGQ